MAFGYTGMFTRCKLKSRRSHGRMPHLRLPIARQSPRFERDSYGTGPLRTRYHLTSSLRRKCRGLRANPPCRPGAPWTPAPVRTVQLAHQDYQPRGRKMKRTKAIRMPGKERPAASQTWGKGLRCRSFTIAILAKNTKPSAVRHACQTAEGLQSRSLRSQPRVLGPGSLRKARPRRNEYYPNTQPPLLNINASLRALRSHIATR